jgi:DDE superfamily endonuclease
MTNRERSQQASRRKAKPTFGCAVAPSMGFSYGWRNLPTHPVKKQAVAPRSFTCVRKKKFGMNMQGTVDHHRRFLHIGVWYPASTSDYLAFSTSNLSHKLEKPNFIALGLCLFGNNAYVNTLYMATPYKAVRSGAKDDYNFYHSQVRINVECALASLYNAGGCFGELFPPRSPQRKSLLFVLPFVMFTTSALTDA